MTFIDGGRGNDTAFARHGETRYLETGRRQRLVEGQGWLRTLVFKG